jgi:hypothetical protein
VQRDSEEAALGEVVDGEIEDCPRDSAIHHALDHARVLLQHQQVVGTEEGDARRELQPVDRGPQRELRLLKSRGAGRGRRQGSDPAGKD